MSVRYSIGIDVECTVKLKDLDPACFTPEGFRELVLNKVGAKGGFFKLSNTTDLTPR